MKYIPVPVIVSILATALIAQNAEKILPPNK